MRIGKIEQGYEAEETVRGPGRARKYLPFYSMKKGDSVRVTIYPFDLTKYRTLSSVLGRIAKVYGGKFTMRTTDKERGRIRVFKVE